MASYRGFNLILAQCYSTRTMRELALSYGVYTSYQEKRKSVDEFIYRSEESRENHGLKGNDIVVVLAVTFRGGRIFIH